MHFVVRSFFNSSLLAMSFIILGRLFCHVDGLIILGAMIFAPTLSVLVNGFTLVVNSGKKFCGKLTIDISEKVTKEKYLYLYNNEKDKYQKIEAKDISTLSIDTTGKYLLTIKPLSGFRVNVILIAGGILAVVIGIGVYIGVKKQYWFW